MKIICIGRNYLDHIQELQNELPEEMVIFHKPNTALHFNEDPWFIPSFSQDIHFECEIVLRIARNGRHIQPDQAMSFVDAWSLGIDFTARDLQNSLKSRGLPWERAKAFDRSAVVGSFMPTADIDMSSIQFEFYQNGQLRQQGDSRKMIYDFQTILVEVSRFFTLQRGDLIYTGTPAGVGPIASGDYLEGKCGDRSVFQIQIK